jgi:hypothetical protein
MSRNPYDYGFYGHIDHWEAYGQLDSPGTYSNNRRLP